MVQLAKNMDSLVLSTGSKEPPPVAPGTVRIYSNRFCPFAQRTLLYLHAKQIPHEVVNVHLMKKPEWFLAKNPLGKVPTLEYNGQIIYESLVCNEWLDEMFPQNRILPKDPTLKAKTYMTVERVSRVGMVLYPVIRELGSQEKAQALRDALMGMEKELKADYFDGAKPGFVDYAIISILERVAVIEHLSEGIAVKMADTPRLETYYKRVCARPEVIATIHPMEIHSKYFHSFATGEPNYNVGITAA